MFPEEEDLKNLEDVDHLNPFNFRKKEERYFLTNDFSEHIFLSPEEFESLIKDELDEESDLFKELWEKGFYKRDLSEYGPLKEKYRKKNARLSVGPSLHIMVVTLRCNQNCIYCQAEAKNKGRKDLDMDKETAREVVDTAFETTSDQLTIEFQGGEPMLNWEVVKFIVNYGRKKEEETGKDLNFSLVTNLTLMTEDKLDFLIDKTVSICTSLDGPKEVHNRNRPFPEGDSYEDVVKWIERYQKRREKERKEGREITEINALVTTTRLTLEKPEELVNEYLRNDLSAIHLRPVSYLGHSGGDFREKMGYSVDEFFEFWKEALDYIVEVNNLGGEFREREAKIKLRKILTDQDAGYTDLSSPCGAALGQITYNYNGEVFTCDEARMINEKLFKMGEVGEDSYEDLVSSDVTQSVVTASLLDNQPCNSCVYKPFCGVCPVKNYKRYGTLFPQIRDTEWCKLQRKQFDYLFSKLEDEDYRKVFKRWVDPYKRTKKEE